MIMRTGWNFPVREDNLGLLVLGEEEVGYAH